MPLAFTREQSALRRDKIIGRITDAYLVYLMKSDDPVDVTLAVAFKSALRAYDHFHDTDDERDHMKPCEEAVRSLADVIVARDPDHFDGIYSSDIGIISEALPAGVL